MKLTFTLADGMQAAIVPIGDLRDLTVQQLGMECLTPAEDAPVVFYVPNKPALDRIRARYGSATC